MDYKRLEIYVGWTCNKKCTYCVEYPTMEGLWGKKVTRYDILKKLIKYKKLWYNHVTYLWWEPFIQSVFFDALKIWKKLWYTILVTTNATLLHINSIAQKYLPYIDELILSVQALEKEKQKKIGGTNVFTYWDEVFENIDLYWNWKMLKCNIVITQDNKKDIFEIVKYLNYKWVVEISITYPDIYFWYYPRKHILKRIAPRYTDCVWYIILIIDFCKKRNISLKIADFPFCIFPHRKLKQYITMMDDYSYQRRMKVDSLEKEINNEDEKNFFLPRDRWHCSKCNECILINKCWWPSNHYEKLYWLDEIKAIHNK